jgi:hypothetical protein
VVPGRMASSCNQRQRVLPLMEATSHCGRPPALDQSCSSATRVHYESPATHRPRL